MSRVNAGSCLAVVDLRVFFGSSGLCLAVLGKQGVSVFRVIDFPRSDGVLFPARDQFGRRSKVETWLILPVAYACLKD